MRALLKQALGMVHGDKQVEAEAKAEIAEIEAKHATNGKADVQPKPPRRTRLKPPTSGPADA
jgi:hypothetical protein